MYSFPSASHSLDPAARLKDNGIPMARIDVFTPPGMYRFPSSTISLDFSEPNEVNSLVLWP